MNTNYRRRQPGSGLERLFARFVLTASQPIQPTLRVDFMLLTEVDFLPG